MKKIFLTGKIGIGKSTIIKNVFEGESFKPGGFVTLPVIEENVLRGFKIRDVATSEEAMIGYFDDNFLIHPVAEGFETVGVKSLENVLSNDARIVIMDELGFLENEAFNFKERVFDVMKSKKAVIGCIKLERNAFLDKVADMATVIEVNTDNRDFLPEEIRRMINEEPL
ncbi:MAG: nucleoside-triphosphatase [Caldisericaceae bacterium]